MYRPAVLLAVAVREGRCCPAGGHPPSGGKGAAAVAAGGGAGAALEVRTGVVRLTRAPRRLGVVSEAEVWEGEEERGTAG